MEILPPDEERSTLNGQPPLLYLPVCPFPTMSLMFRFPEMGRSLEPKRFCCRGLSVSSVDDVMEGRNDKILIWVAQSFVELFNVLI